SAKRSVGDVPGEAPAGATALIDAASMDTLQAQSRRSSSMPPPSDAQATSVLDTNKLTELVDESSSVPVPIPQPDLDMPRRVAAANPADANPPPRRDPQRSKYTPTLRSVHFEKSAPQRPWLLALGVVVFGAGAGSFLAIEPPSATDD